MGRRVEVCGGRDLFNQLADWFYNLLMKLFSRPVFWYKLALKERWAFNCTSLPIKKRKHILEQRFY